MMMMMKETPRPRTGCMDLQGLQLITTQPAVSQAGQGCRDEILNTPLVMKSRPSITEQSLALSKTSVN